MDVIQLVHGGSRAKHRHKQAVAKGIMEFKRDCRDCHPFHQRNVESIQS